MTDHVPAAGKKVPDLIANLRALARHEHDDLSIGAEAADEIERLCKQLRKIKMLAWKMLQDPWCMAPPRHPVWERMGKLRAALAQKEKADG